MRLDESRRSTAQVRLDGRLVDESRAREIIEYADSEYRRRHGVQRRIVTILVPVSTIAAWAFMKTLLPVYWSVPLLLVLGAIAAVAMAFIGRSAWRQNLRVSMNLHGVAVCVRCGYDLRDIPSPVCPECGLPIPSKPTKACAAHQG